MEAVCAAVSVLNPLAQVRVTSHSVTSPDWVLDIQGYTQHTLQRQVSAGVVVGAAGSLDQLSVCVPCGPLHPIDSLTSSSSSIGVGAVPIPNNALNKQASKTDTVRASDTPMNSSSPTDRAVAVTGPESLSSASFQVAGAMDVTLLKQYLDALLYGNGEVSVSASTGTSNMNISLPSSSSALGVSGNETLVDISKRSKVENQMKIFRMKGVVCIHGSDKLYLLQAVHDIFSLTVSEYSVSDEISVSKFIVIGRYIDRNSILEGLLRCCVTKQ